MSLPGPGVSLMSPPASLAMSLRRTPHEAGHGQEMRLRRIEEENREWDEDLGARFKRATVAPTKTQKEPFGARPRGFLVSP